ncbi:MAG: ABC transporter permease [Rhodospirillales bacterium]|nr:ABC transporter permease [Rhodospirillales bacterium]
MRPDTTRTTPPVRAEFERAPGALGDVGAITRERSRWQRLTDRPAIRRGFILLALAILWQVYASRLHNPLLFPSFTSAMVAWWRALVFGPLLLRAWNSVSTLLIGYGIGIVLALALTTTAVLSRIGEDFLSTLTAMFSPLPAIALLPLALIWFGLGKASIIFVLVHAVLWAVAVNVLAGFVSVSDTLRMAGRNCGLRGWRYVMRILVPAASPAILAGLKVGWMFAWRTEIAAELVFGATSGSGGIGWYIFENQNDLQTAAVFGGLLTVIVIGLLVEGLVFRTIELQTVRKWGMQR